MGKNLLLQKARGRVAKGKDGKVFTFDTYFVEVNGIQVSLKPKGETAWSAVDSAFVSGVKLYVNSEKGTYEKEDGTVKEFDQLYVDLNGEHAPLVTKDGFGRRLILKFLMSV